ncbi:MAG: acetamidase/formamidase family protein, partial [Tetragenococcus koreensis]|nr:acetamidase/formamidase family protein [Tetragenococcus koreensis]MDN6847435.1 acetamidase/formamidase family protein [Tetragenococcus koreensis]
GPDLMTGAQEALRSMIDYVSETYSIEKVDAYLLASLCVDLKISEVVDAGQYVVSALLPLSIFNDSQE